jgi:hypothetical protein
MKNVDLKERDVDAIRYYLQLRITLVSHEKEANLVMPS